MIDHHHSAADHDPPSSRHEAFKVGFDHRVHWTPDAFGAGRAGWLPVLTGTEQRAIAVIDAGVADRWPDLAGRIAACGQGRYSLALDPIIVPGGEPAKNDWDVVNRVTAAIDKAGLCRHAWVLAIGGGAMLDATGFAAAIAHRGVRLVRFPTTTLGQGDAGIGVKNGINAFGKKNFLGSFAPPWAVINDPVFLETLSDRDYRCGFSEAVKVALLKDPEFFQTIRTLTPRLAARDLRATRTVLERSADLHLEHITRGGDPFEVQTQRPLDFGHWAAHKLEQMTGFGLRHGEAVAIGVALDTMYAAGTGRLDPAAADVILRSLRDLGFAVYHEAMDRTDELLAGIEEFREHLGGSLSITLVTAVGSAVEVDEIDAGAMADAIGMLAAVSAGA